MRTARTSRTLLIVFFPFLLLGQPREVRNGEALLRYAKTAQTDKAIQTIQEVALVNMKDGQGLTALEWASSNGDEKLIDALLAERSNVTPAAVRLAEANGHRRVAARLQEEAQSGRAHSTATGGADATLLAAAERGDVPKILQALRSGANIEAKNPAGATALLLATKGGHESAARVLSDRGAATPDGGGSKVEGSSNVGSSLTAIRNMSACLARSRDSRIRFNAQRAGQIVSNLEGRWKRQRQARGEVSLEYKENLARLAARSKELTLSSADCSEIEGALALRDLEEIMADLETKLRHCQITNTELGGSVTVRVHTKKGVTETPGWTIHYLAKIDESSPGAEPDRFPQFSSPTEFAMPPGRYVIWATQPQGSVTSKKSVLTVLGKNVVEFDLAVP